MFNLGTFKLSLLLSCALLSFGVQAQDQAPKDEATAKKLLIETIVSSPNDTNAILKRANEIGLTCYFNPKQIDLVQGFAFQKQQYSIAYAIEKGCQFKVSASPETDTKNTKKWVKPTLISLGVAGGVGLVALLAKENAKDDVQVPTAPEPTPEPPTGPTGWALEGIELSGRTYDQDIVDQVIGSNEFGNFNNGGRPDQASHPLIATGIPAAYGFGLFGRDINIGIIDSGFNVTHEEFIGKIVGSVNQLDPDLEAANHGTHVAAIAAGALGGTGSMGIAPSANLFLANFDTSLESYNYMIDNQVDVINNSYSSRRRGGTRFHNEDVEAVIRDNDNVNDYVEAIVVLRTTALDDDISNIVPNPELVQYHRDTFDAFNRAQDHAVLVWSNSNGVTGDEDADTFTSDNQQQLSAALPYFDQKLKDAWIAVSNADFMSNQINSENDLEYKSQVCGVTAEYCLVQDGHYITNAYAGNDEQYATSSGTSQAAPIVSGSIALLAEAFPNHTPAQLTARLLASANNRWFQDQIIGTRDFGNGVQHSYSLKHGHGIIDMTAALSPVGTTRMAVTAGTVESTRTETGQLFDPRSPSVKANTTLGAALVKGLGDLSVPYTDALGGQFAATANHLIRGTNSPNRSVNELHKALSKPTTDISTNLRQGLNFNFKQESADIFSGQIKPNDSYSISYAADNYGLNLSSNTNAEDALGFSGQDLPKGFSKGTDTFGGLGLTGLTSLATSLNGKFGTTSVVGLRSGDDENTSVLGGFATHKFKSDKAEFIVAFGGLKDSGVLGNAFEQAFQLDGSRSLVASGQLKYKLNNNVQFLAKLVAGQTSVQNRLNSLIAGPSKLTSLGGSLSLIVSDGKKPNDFFSFGVSVPTKVVSGALRVNTPVYSLETDSYSIAERRVDLSSGGTEIRFDAQMAKEIAKGVTFNTRGALRLNPDHNSSAKHEVLLHAGLKFAF